MVRADPRHTHPGSEQYSFLHAALLAEQNNLVGCVGRGGVLCVLRREQCRGWRGEKRRLFFVGEHLALVRDGRSLRRGGEVWQTVFSDAVVGKERPFVVVGGEVV